MHQHKVDYLNIALIFISLLLAVLLPFRLFIFGYAILGPLHYFTEINWLQSKNYFVKQRNWVWVPVLFSFLILLPKVFYHPAFSSLMESEGFKYFVEGVNSWSNGFIFIWLVMSMGLVFIERQKVMILSIIGAVLLAFWFNGMSLYG